MNDLRRKIYASQNSVAKDALGRANSEGYSGEDTFVFLAERLIAALDYHQKRWTEVLNTAPPSLIDSM